MTKTCKHCGREKPETAFNAYRARGRTYLKGVCRDCFNARSRTYHNAARVNSCATCGGPAVNAYCSSECHNGAKKKASVEQKEKACTKCRAVKPAGEFPRWNSKGRLRLANRCRPCLAEGGRSETAKEKRRDYNKRCLAERGEQLRREAVEKKRRVKAEVLAAYGGRCACCGEATPEFLAVDHINGLGARKREGAIYSFLKARGFPKDNYRLLCHNCNTSKGLLGFCPHVEVRAEYRTPAAMRHLNSATRSCRTLKLETIAAYGGACACCGVSAPEFLSIDHIHADRSLEPRLGYKLKGANLCRWLKRQGWPKDHYQILCLNCNMAKGLYGRCPHDGGRSEESQVLAA